MQNPPFDQRIARVLVRPLIGTFVSPNHLTTVSLFLALAGAVCLAKGENFWQNCGAGLFILARFLDHWDGELARQSGRQSRLGYYFDYATGGLSYAALFCGIGFGLVESTLDTWAISLGLMGAVSAVLAMGFNLWIDTKTGGNISGTAVGYPNMAGFELEDGIYLLAPLTWFGCLVPFFTAAGVGATVYCLWTLIKPFRLWMRHPENALSRVEVFRKRIFD